MEYYKPEEILGYCSRCPNYGSYWSCPPHSFSVPKYLSQYKWVYILGMKVFPNKVSGQSDPLEYYHVTKKDFNIRLINREQLFPGSEVLISGHCHVCDICSRQIGKTCTVPSRQRYSLESLGVKISDLLRDYFNDNLQWKGSEIPDYMYIITGILSVQKIKMQKIKMEVLVSEISRKD
ncbi:MAG: hypothetical protein GY754_36385 [bacterium]|nr:hypothetical protein [bacterium]